MKFSVSRKRRLFGREVQFSDYSYSNNKELYTEVTPVTAGATSQENILEIKRLELEQGTQVREGERGKKREKASFVLKEIKHSN